MSCRVIERNMEFAMLDELVRQCTKKGVTEIIGYYYQSDKNNMEIDHKGNNIILNYHIGFQM